MPINGFKGLYLIENQLVCHELYTPYTYEIGKIVKHNGELEIGKSGLHFCQNLMDVFSYYSYEPDIPQIIYAEVEAIGKVIDGEDISVTDALVVKKLLNGKYEDCEFLNGQITYFRLGLNQCWFKDGKYHRDDDLPAVEWADGTRQWYFDGKLHRDCDLPAVECADGTRKWYIDGKLHRDGGLPAIEEPDGKCVKNIIK